MEADGKWRESERELWEGRIRDKSGTNKTVDATFMSRKRAATSPLNPDFEKKSRMGLTDEELNELNENLRDWALDHSALSNPEDVSTRVFAQTFQQIVINVLDTFSASTIDKSWKKVNYGEEHINLLSREDQFQLATIWVEAREKGDWERFVSHCALIPSHRFPHE